MALKTKLSLVSLDKSGAILKIKDTTGVYSVDTPEGYGTPNASTLNSISFEVSRWNSALTHLVEQTLAVVNPLLPTINQIVSSDEVTLNSHSLGINSAEQGLQPFTDGVLEVKMHVVPEIQVSAVATAGNPFITGTGLTPYLEYEYIKVGTKLYRINKTLPTLDGGILHLMDALTSTASYFYPVETALLRVLVTQNSTAFLSNSVGRMAKGCCGCSPARGTILELCKIYAWKQAAEEAFNAEDYSSADKLLQDITSYASNGNCSC